MDLLVIADSKEPRYRRSARLYGVLSDILIPMDILVYSPEEVEEWSGVRQAFVTTAIREEKCSMKTKSDLMNPKVQAIMDKLRSRFEMVYGPRLERIILYGSHARGEAEPGSDIDVLVVLKGPVNSGEEISRTGAIITEFSLGHGEVISCVFMDADQFMHRNGPLLRNVRREGIAV